jgi:hypothetical protein
MDNIPSVLLAKFDAILLEKAVPNNVDGFYKKCEQGRTQCR